MTEAHAPQGLCSATREAKTTRSLSTTTRAQPSLAATRESPCAATKTQYSPQKKTRGLPLIPESEKAEAWVFCPASAPCPESLYFPLQASENGKWTRPFSLVGLQCLCLSFMPCMLHMVPCRWG